MGGYFYIELYSLYIFLLMHSCPLKKDEERIIIIIINGNDSVIECFK